MNWRPALYSAVKILLTVFAESVLVYFAQRHPALITPILLMVGAIAIVPASIFVFDGITYVSRYEQVRQLIEAYVVPWQQYLVATMLLCIKKTLISKHYESKQSLADIVQFLDTTDRTRYLRGVLSMPSLRFLESGTTGMMVLKRWIRKCRVDRLRSKIEVLKALSSMQVPSREKELCSYILKVGKRIVPNFDRVESEIAEKLNQTTDDVSLLGIDDREYHAVVQDIKPPQKCELEIWNCLIPQHHPPMTSRELKKRISWGIFWQVFPLLGLIVFLAVAAIRMVLTVSWSSSLIMDIVYALMVVACVFGLSTPLLILMARTIKNYRSLEPLLKDKILFTRGDLARGSAEILKHGLDRLELPDLVNFPDGKITLRNFVYRCACAFVPDVSRKRAIVWFPTSHKITTTREEFFHSKPDATLAAFGTVLDSKNSITRDELTELSSRITTLCEGRVDHELQSQNVEKLAWLYSNVLRVREFDQIEAARVGRLASYMTSDRVR
jgi:hypothetical protein